MTYIVGIDPGRYGAVAVLDHRGVLESVVDLETIGPIPVAGDLAALLLAIAPAEDLYVVLEEPFATNPARASLLPQGIGYGVLLGVVGALDIKHAPITPKKWKTILGVPMGSYLSTAEKKRNSINHATMLWPEMAHRWPLKKHDGRAEACLIGEAGRQLWEQELGLSEDEE